MSSSLRILGYTSDGKYVGTESVSCRDCWELLDFINFFKEDRFFKSDLHTVGLIKCPEYIHDFLYGENDIDVYDYYFD